MHKTLVALMGGVTVGFIGLSVAEVVSTDATTPSVPIVQPAPCDPVLVMADLDVMDRAYVLAITGHPREAKAEAFRNYAALDPHECEDWPEVTK